MNFGNLERSTESMVPARSTPQAAFAALSAPPLALPHSGGLAGYASMLSRRKWLIAAITLSGALIGLAAALVSQPVYRAHSSIEVQNPNEAFLNMKDLAPTAAFSTNSPQSYIETQARILQNDALLEKTARQVGLSTRPELLERHSLLEKPLAALGLKRSSPGPLGRDAMLAVLARDLKIQTSSEHHILDVYFESTDPAFAARFTNTLTQAFVEDEMESRWGTTKRMGEYLNRELEHVKQSYEQSAAALQEEARTTGLLFDQDKGSTVAEERLRQLQEELSRAQADRIGRQSRYEIAANSPPDALPEVLDNPTLKEYHVRLAELRRQYVELSAQFTPKFPKVTSVQAQIAQLESAVKALRADILGRLRNENETAQRREQMVTASYEVQSRLVSDQAAKAVHYNVLKRDVETNRELYQSLLQKMKESSVASAMRASSIRVISPAEAPTTPAKPNTRANAGMGFIAGLFLSVAFVFLREHTDRRLRFPGDASSLLEVRELAAIPTLPQRALFAKGAASPLNAITSPLAQALSGGGPGMWLAESFRAALASLWFFDSAGVRSSAIVFTSPKPGEGKTTLVSSLGIALANANRRVLLIDADIKKPSLHSAFGLPNRRGLSELLEEKDLPKPLFDAHFQPTYVPNLFVLPAGRGEGDIGSLRHSDYLGLLLEHLRSHFDAILIDTPPALASPDARVLGHLADGVVLVFRANRTTRDDASAVLQRFGEDRTAILGAILNGWRHTDPHYGYPSPRRNGFASRDGDTARTECEA